jgi:hypothetical protein
MGRRAHGRAQPRRISCNLGLRQIDRIFRSLALSSSDHLRSKCKKGVTPWGAAVKRRRQPSRLGTSSTTPLTLTIQLCKRSSVELLGEPRAVTLRFLQSQITRHMKRNMRISWRTRTKLTPAVSARGAELIKRNKPCTTQSLKAPATGGDFVVPQTLPTKMPPLLNNAIAPSVAIFSSGGILH